MTASADLDLLRRFEPVIRYTKGEQFFPMNVELYVRACSLWVQRSNEEPVRLLSRDELTIDDLARPFPDEFGAVHFLKLTNPLTPAELAAYNLKKRFMTKQVGKNGFRAGQGRLARVGYASRFFDALFTLGLLARGRVPGDTAAAAAIVYDRLMAEAGRDRYRYYGRVVRENGWIVVQYWFFYMFNNWRSGFFGVNDHEGDWEMISIYLYEQAGEVFPEWVAYAAHDYEGDDLRRHWADPEVEKVEEHPVIFAGAGSHSSYFTRGEYLTAIELPALARLGKVANKIQDFWHDTLRQYGGEEDGELSPNSSTVRIFRIPFVDYARGDGLSLGPGQDVAWASPYLLGDPPPAWVSNYRGLWGLYARDPLGGENAPSGPMYNRDGTVRRAWHDPLGWAGLNKVPTPEQALDTVLVQQTQVKHRQTDLETTIAAKTYQLQQLGVETAAMRGQPHLEKLYDRHRQQLAELSEEIGQLKAELALEQTLLESLRRYARDLRAGKRGPLRDHIRRAHQPTSPEELRLSRLAEFWAAVSIGLMLITVVGLSFFARNYLIWGLVAAISLFLFIESGFRGRLINLASSFGIGLSIVSALILAYEFFWPIVNIAVLVIGGYLLLENLRELWA